MFNNSKYTKWYYQIINNALNEYRTKNCDIYYENHHIVPRSLGGEKSLTVLLTFKEHYICHHLLCKMVEDMAHITKMKYALYMMSRSYNKEQRTLLHYQNIKCLQALRSACKTRKHKSFLGKKHTIESKALISEKLKGRIYTDKTREKIKLNNKVTNESRSKKVKEFQSGRVKTEEHKQKLSESIKKSWKQRKRPSTLPLDEG